MNDDFIKLPLKFDNSNKLFTGVLQSRKSSKINTSLYNSPENIHNMLQSP